MKYKIKKLALLLSFSLAIITVKGQFELYNLCDFGSISKQAIHPTHLIEKYSHSYSDVSGRNEINFYSSAIGNNCRPLIVFISGGFFINVDPSGMEQHAKYFAQRGYLTATVNYRVVETDQRCSDLAWWQSTQDVHAATKYACGISKIYDWARFNNQKVILVGSSAGAVTALTLTYSSSSDMISYLPNAANQFGWLDYSVFPPYSSSLYQIIGTVSLAGAMPEIINTDGYNFNEKTSVLFIHAIGDKTVPYDIDVSTPCKNMPSPKKVYGPNALKKRITKSRFPPEVISLSSDQHKISINDHLDTINSFIHKVSTDSSINYLLLDDFLTEQVAHENGINIYPNPSNGNFKVKIPFDNNSLYSSSLFFYPSISGLDESTPATDQQNILSLEIIDINGIVVYSYFKPITDKDTGNEILDLQTGLKKGIYTLRVNAHQKITTEKIMITN